MKEQNRSFGRSKIDDPDFAKAVAMAFVEGLTHKDIGELFGVNKATIGRWVRDPRVRAHAARIAEDRILRIVRKTDAIIESRLSELEKSDFETILKVRKEFLNNAMKIEVTPGATAETVNETLNALEDNPEMAAALQQILEGEKLDESGAKQT